MTAPASDRPPAADGEPASTRWILVVDDDEATRLALEEVLIDEGYLVRTAQHGQDALEILRTGNKPPALVVVDMMMPVMDGWAFIGVMRQEPMLADVGVVAMSAGGNGLLAMAPVSSDYLPKPVNLERLLGTVRRFCGCPGSPPSWKSSGSYARELDTALEEPEVD
jgi:CheY-like chemotaxis protein